MPVYCFADIAMATAGAFKSTIVGKEYGNFLAVGVLSATGAGRPDFFFEMTIPPLITFKT